MRNWISVFRLYHSHVRTNGETGRPPMEYDSMPENQRFIEMLSKKVLLITA